MSPSLAVPGLLAAVAGMFVACHSAATITCSSGADCIQGGIPGSCRPSPSSDASFCSFTDTTCPGGERWGAAAGDGLAETCVAEGGHDGGVGELDAAPDANTSPDYFRRLGGAGSDGVSRVVAAPDGSAFVVGSFRGATDLGVGPMNSAGGLDGYVASLSPAGEPRWAKRFGAASDDVVASAAASPDGSVVVGGTFTGPVNFGCGLKTETMASSFLVKLSSTGDCIWSIAFSAGLVDLALDDAGDIYVAGTFTGQGLFGGSVLNSAGSNDVFLSRFDGATGIGAWSERIGSTHSEQVKGIAVHGDQLTIVADTFGDTDFGGGVLSSNQSAIVVAKYATASGAYVWAKQLAKSSNVLSPSYADAVAFDPQGNVLVAGTFSGPTDLGAGPVTPVNLNDTFVAKLSNTTGGFVWAEPLGGGGDEEARALAALPQGGAVVVGSITGPAMFGTFQLFSTGGFDAFAVALSSSGVPESAVSWGSTGDDSATSVTVDHGRPSIAGTFSASVDFGDFGAVATSSGSSDVFVIRHALP